VIDIAETKNVLARNAVDVDVGRTKREQKRYDVYQEP
jgi:hypothetical protein